MHKHVQLFDELHLSGQILGTDIFNHVVLLKICFCSFSIIFILGDEAKQFKDQTFDPPPLE
jgi:hypothetical protein